MKKALIYSILAAVVLGAAAAVVAFAPVENPQVPASVEICGQKVDIDAQFNYERLDRELTSIMYTHGNTLLCIKRANRYFPQIAPILRECGMPDDLLYLACIESNLATRARSGAGAAGIWQFMPATAKEYGLIVNDEVDERLNIDLATRAACKYFKRARSTYNGDWMSAMASYNTGMGRITKQLREQGVESATDLYLSEETMRYPFRVIAMKMIMENPRRYGFQLSEDQLYFPREVEVVEVDSTVTSWPQWALDRGINFQILRDENPWIIAQKLTNRSRHVYHVRVPSAESLKRSTARRSVYNSNWVTQQ